MLSRIVMATHGTPSPRVLILGHSFIRRLRDFIERNPGDLDLAFKLKEPAAIFWRIGFIRLRGIRDKLTGIKRVLKS